ncbi:MAG: hemerythrin domain-containing protein, partial [Bryobacteraceae bacterium]
FLGALCLAAEGYTETNLDPAARVAIATALRYFRDAAPHHTEDEERDLFPLLSTVDENGKDCIATLEEEHRHAQELHAQVDRLGSAWLERDQLTEAERASLQAALRELAKLYGAHIAFEENEVFPIARRVVGKDRLEAMGRHMAARRGVAYIPAMVPFGADSARQG